MHLQEGECGKLHDKLETETIGASVLRHKLQTFPEEIKTQLQGEDENLMNGRYNDK